MGVVNIKTKTIDVQCRVQSAEQCHFNAGVFEHHDALCIIIIHIIVVELRWKLEVHCSKNNININKI